MENCVRWVDAFDKFGDLLGFCAKVAYVPACEGGVRNDAIDLFDGVLRDVVGVE